MNLESSNYQEYDSDEYNNHLTEFDYYNNEMIGIISVYYIISKVKRISASKAMLIIPITTHNALISYLNDSRTIVKGIEQLIIKKPEFFSNFNQRFLSSIELSVNSILILIKLNLIYIGDDGNLNINVQNKIHLVDEKKLSLLGVRANNIINASLSVAELLTEETQNLYLQMRVKL